MKRWTIVLAVVACAALVTLPAPAAFAQEDWEDEEIYDEEYGEGDEEYLEEFPDEDLPPDEAGEEVEAPARKPSRRAVGPDGGAGSGSAAPRWHWGPWFELRVQNEPTYPVGLFVARGPHEIGVGFLFLGGFLRPEDFDDASVLEVESGYSSLELAYKYFLGARYPEGQAGEGWWVGAGASLASYDADVSTADGLKGDTSSNFAILRVSAGHAWRSGNLELGAGAGLEFIPSATASVTVSGGTATPRTAKAAFGSDLNFYGALSIGYRF